MRLWEYILFAALGFFLGGILFSYHLPKLLRGVDVCAEKDHNPGAGARRKLENATPGCARSTLEWLRATGSSCML